jgi:prepilin signal peptidase PulO-like enzyme (type II secretory pathway)
MGALVAVPLFLVGLALGSFVNVFTLRYQPSDKPWALADVRGRSRCLSCLKTLSWYELIPLVSFIIQRGKCRACNAVLSLQYPLVEMCAGLVTVGVPLTLQSAFMMWNPAWGTWFFVFTCVLWIAALLTLFAIAVIDLRHYLIPNALNLFLLVLGIAWVAVAGARGVFGTFGGGSFLRHFAPLFFVPQNYWLSHAIGSAVSVLFFVGLVIFSRGRGMGMGDVKLIGALGFLFGWPDVVMVVLLSFIIGAVIAVALMALGRKRMSDLVPFGPFIVAASYAVFFLGAGVLEAYFGIIGV